MNDFLEVYQFEERVKEDFNCMRRILEIYNSLELLQKLEKEPTLPNVCFVELINLRKSVSLQNSLSYENYIQSTITRKDMFQKLIKKQFNS